MSIEENKTLNFFKGITCLGVVFIHVPFPGLTGELIKKIFSYAVPFFILISGYYSFGCDKSTIVRRKEKIIKIFLFSFLLYFIFKLLIHIRNGFWITWLVSEVFTYNFLIKLIFFCTIDFAIPLWYLVAMIETYTFWQLVLEKKYENKILKTLPILFILQIFHVMLCETLNFSWAFKINFLTRALPWFLLGYKLNDISKRSIKIINNKSLYLGMFLGILITILPTLLNSSIDFSCIGYIFLTPMLFYFCIQNKDKCKFKYIVLLGRKLSLYVYIFHPIINEILIFSICPFFTLDINYRLFVYLYPFLICFITVLVSSIYIYIKKFLLNFIMY